MNSIFYPFSFYPIFKERIWGGNKLKSVLGKNISTESIGESWEISTVPENISVISNGIFKDKNLNEIIDKFPAEILGTAVYQKFGNQFPLLFKYLDANKDLSIQVHPNDELAKKRHNSFGKTEMWYVIQADIDSRIIVGFKEKTNSEDYITSLRNKKIISILDDLKVVKGDAFFLETGTIHGIGAGIIVAEIQQTSDITYRIFDFERKDINGKERELHIDLSVDAINYNKIESQKWYTKKINTSNVIVNCKYFTTNYIDLDGSMDIHKDQKSFTVYMCIEGNFKISIEDKFYDYKKGDTLLIPAQLGEYKIHGTATLLEIYIS